METNEDQVIRNIKSVQKRYGLLDNYIANKLNITERTYINIKNHPFNYSINKLNEIANVIGCNINEFFYHFISLKVKKKNRRIRKKINKKSW
jgi:transcriptional regulator with XRE-family HTH domain